MGKFSRDKGLRNENKIVRLHAEAGIKAERVPDSGASKFHGSGHDIEIYAFGTEFHAPLRAEVKAKASRVKPDGTKVPPDGWAKIIRDLGGNDLLFLIEDRKAPLVVMPWRVWMQLIGGTDDAASTGREERQDDDHGE